MRILAPLAALALTVSVGCNNGGGFASGGNDPATGEAKEEPEEDPGPKKKGKGTTTTAPAAGTATDVGTTGDQKADAAPAYAVKEGRFKAWTVPQIPADKQDYQFFVQVTLPPNVNPQTLSKTDLSGLVRGSDGFELKLEKTFEPLPKAVPIEVPFDPRGKFEVKGNVATLSFFVPYAPKHDSDTITVHSKSLNEDATLTIDY